MKTDTQIDSSGDSASSFEVSISERLSDVSKRVALVLGIFYVVGLLIVNMELGKYGMFSLGLDRPEYVLAGALWVFLSVIPILIFRAWMTLVSTPESIKDVRAIGKMLPSILAGYVAFSYFLGILSDYEFECLVYMAWSLCCLL